MTTPSTEDAEVFDGRIGRVFSTSEPSWPPRPTAPEGAPNVVVVLVDDMGYSDVGCFGAEIRTPNIDDMAAEGVRLTNFHVNPFCSPTRASLLTGRNSHAVGMGSVANVDPGFPGYTSVIDPQQPTAAEIFRQAGYSTFMVGKWHLSKDAELNEAGDRSSWPLQRGFDEYYGILEAMTNLHHPHRLYEGNSVVEVDEYPDDYYLTDDLTDRAIRMMKGCKAADPSRPFFLYFAHLAVHAPLHAKSEDVERYRGMYEQGWDALREQRLAEQVRLGIMPEGTRLPPRNYEEGEHVVAWDELGDLEKQLFARYMEVYAGMVDNVDQSVGKLRDALTEMGELDNTVFVVLSDNGASREGNEQGGSHYHRGASREPGKRTQSRDFLEIDARYMEDMGGPNTWPHYPRGWAMACNTPFRLYKITTYAGGHQVPFVLSWPDGLGHLGGAIRHQYAHVTDLLPTLLDLCGLDDPDTAPMDGVSFNPVMASGEVVSKHREQYYESFGHRAYYAEGWEAVSFRVPDTPFSKEQWQLFDLTSDPTQVDDLAQEHPQVVRDLIERWDQAARDNQVYPLHEGGGISMLIRPPWEERFVEPVRLTPGTPTLERYRSSRLISDRSFVVRVDWDLHPGDEGVLFAHGGQESGYVLYLRDGVLVYAHNYSGEVRTLDPVAVGEGSRQLELRVNAPGGGRWDVELLTDTGGRAVGEGFQQLSGFIPFEGIDVGADRRSPVLWDLYQERGAFPFTGVLHAVTYEPGDLAPDAATVAVERYRQQGPAFE